MNLLEPLALSSIGRRYQVGLQLFPLPVGALIGQLIPTFSKKMESARIVAFMIPNGVATAADAGKSHITERKSPLESRLSEARNYCTARHVRISWNAASRGAKE